MEKVTAGTYTHGPYTLTRNGRVWQVTRGRKHLLTFLSFKYAKEWLRSADTSTKPKKS